MAHSVMMILAAGKGTRLNVVDQNKTALPFNGKPLIAYAVELGQAVSDRILIVTGFQSESVKMATKDYKLVDYVEQPQQLGTGHAVQIGMDYLREHAIEADSVLVGYGDHMMFYTPQVVRELIALHESSKAVVTMVSAWHDDPNSMGWGRIIRNGDTSVMKIVEQKDATSDECEVKELNAGFYVFSRSFLDTYLDKLVPSSVTGEYYLTDMIALATEHDLLVSALKVPFSSVGIGVNTAEQLEASKQLFHERS